MTACFGITATGSAMAQSSGGAAFTTFGPPSAGISVSALSMNGKPAVDHQTAVGPGTSVSVTATSTPGGWASASAFATSSSGSTSSTADAARSP